MGLDARDVLALAHRDCVGGSATAAVVQRRWDPRGVDDVETDAVEALAGADGDGLDAVSRGHQLQVGVLVAVRAAEDLAQLKAVFESSSASCSQCHGHEELGDEFHRCRLGLMLMAGRARNWK